MPGVSVKKEKVLNPLQRFLGEQARIVSSINLSVSNFIQAERMEVNLADDNQQEDTGMLYLYPLDENKFCLQLCYLQYEDSSSNGVVYSLRFLPSFFDQYPSEILIADKPFRFDKTTEQSFSICAQTCILLSQLAHDTLLAPFMKSLKQTETAIHLLRRALECIIVPFTACQVPACRFLAYETEREKIQEAISIIGQHLDQPHTIRELSRKVAMNECYLKKGFKTVVGKTIHEYQQELRITKAKELLQQQNLSVTDVANTLGYSSISHFSTAFKRVTGMKPCELLA